MKNIILIAVVILVLIGGGTYILMSENNQLVENESNTPTTPTSATPEMSTKEASSTPEEAASDEPTSILGNSAGGEAITAYHFGTGETELLFIGGIHGGYSWNTSLLAFELIDWLEENEDKVPKNVKVTIIPVLNPDGLKVVTGTTGLFKASAVNTSETVRITGRFNANEVDINRNFDCEWESVGTWQNRSVSGGETPFSEPESAAVKAYVEANKPATVVTWYSAAGGVYSSSCNNGISTETKDLTNLFAKAAGYTAHEEFDYYQITGDMVNWFAGQNIPAISVLLTNHTDTEFSKNLSGLQAMLTKYAE
ncbi:hypothetical protein A3I99_02985 [Candidatus Kaiserbacteria bacterium RIFCSPLOWO2_02_FULL_45_11b]|uniref:Peptidase M14 domain-containing protein n=1 Tax=Candidatus Kaiserbacteria bacterium RIFCSPLOWO2_12_FULL_45_26 TaxID=1798525 RepID=A0A1F6FFH0_9BACT|nr:MAG: hypothetical protein A2929_03125 [Candidatus Kaiserbacteria bacterium RIFCSPLOWO2_01_FULL_45_25]OGG82009.1 MAG: hypothetical protein A3I99_02985 [Candidatus Kaiserbacteria bacterium RIFCSPLOWO2_02_FULL_45_11b]OGG84609.1 MAG: hypothetical protein A3G90_00775 [Candidatus Kaiserbacteria bacterium RIFCSPLOWO2_12_FULL_45_26]